MGDFTFLFLPMAFAFVPMPCFYQPRIEGTPLDLPITNAIYVKLQNCSAQLCIGLSKLWYGWKLKLDYHCVWLNSKPQLNYVSMCVITQIIIEIKMINLYKHTLFFIIQIKLQIVSHYQFVSCHLPKSCQYVPKNKSLFAMNRSSLFVDISICKVLSFLKQCSVWILRFLKF